MVNGVYKSLNMLYRRYEALVCFFKDEVEEGTKGSLLILRQLTSFHFVCRFLSLVDVTEVLTKGLCLEQMHSVTVLHIGTLNKEIFQNLDELIDSNFRENEDIGCRFGPRLKKHAKSLYKYPPSFLSFELKGKGSKRRNKDTLHAVRSLQKKAACL